MKLRLLAPIVVAAMTIVQAHAQATGLYINPVAYRISNSTADTGTFAFLGQNSTSAMFYGVNLGGYYDLPATGSINAGVDVRESITNGNGATRNSFLLGLRVSPRGYIHSFKPYLQPSVGLGSTKAPTSAIHIRKVEYGIYGGLDYALGRHVDFRVIEIGFGSLTTASSATIGRNGVVPAATLLGFSSGLVFRIP